MIIDIMFIIAGYFIYLIAGFYPTWHWIPESPQELMLEGIALVAFFQIAVMIRLSVIKENLMKKDE